MKILLLILIIANSATCQKVFVFDVPDSLWSVTQSSKFLNHGDSLVTFQYFDSLHMKETSLSLRGGNEYFLGKIIGITKILNDENLLTSAYNGSKLEYFAGGAEKLTLEVNFYPKRNKIYSIVSVVDGKYEGIALFLNKRGKIAKIEFYKENDFLWEIPFVKKKFSNPQSHSLDDSENTGVERE